MNAQTNQWECCGWSLDIKDSCQEGKKRKESLGIDAKERAEKTFDLMSLVLLIELICLDISTRPFTYEINI